MRKKEICKIIDKLVDNAIRKYGLEDEKTVRGAVLQDRRGYTITEYDLCDECRDQLLDFLNP